jgi:SAM-dependent methyltransferase
MNELAWHQKLVASLPHSVRRLILRFETIIEERLEAFSQSLGDADTVLDAGAGELQYAQLFDRERYFSMDLGVGDVGWDYGRIDVVGDLAAIPFRDQSFDAVINVVVLEHTRQPHQVVREMGRVLRNGGRMLIVVPQEWGMHQLPHDYFRFTRPGLEMLLRDAGFSDLTTEPVGGFFTLLGRRVLDSTLFFQGGWRWLALPFVAFLAAPLGILLPFLDFLDPARATTLGYVCEARKGGP